MNATNGVKNFMWRACKNLLTTKDNLLKRRLVGDLVCPICNVEAETTLHALWECTASRDVWGASARFLQKSSFNGVDFLHFDGALYAKGGDEVLTLFLEIARRIWLRRNSWIYKGKFSHPDSIIL
jgi:hypothetical protein